MTRVCAGGTDRAPCAQRGWMERVSVANNIDNNSRQLRASRGQWRAPLRRLQPLPSGLVTRMPVVAHGGGCPYRQALALALGSERRTRALKRARPGGGWREASRRARRSPPSASWRGLPPSRRGAPRTWRHAPRPSQPRTARAGPCSSVKAAVNKQRSAASAMRHRAPQQPPPSPSSPSLAPLQLTSP